MKTLMIGMIGIGLLASTVSAKPKTVDKKHDKKVKKHKKK